MNITEQALAFAAEADGFLANNPGIERIEVLYAGFTGTVRGKWLPPNSLPKLAEGCFHLPTSTVALDVWGIDVPGLGLALERGDPDGVGVPVSGTIARIPWASRPSAQVMVTLHEKRGHVPAVHEPRHVLKRVVDAWHARGLKPVVATEVEFYLIDEQLNGAGHPQTPCVPGRSDRLTGGQVYDMDVLSSFEELLADIVDACQVQNLPADTVIAEYGPGQFEINLRHVPDAVRAADQCVMLKRVIRHVARAHGYRATFMAKPYAEHPGSGLHVHTSAVDASRTNVFSGRPEMLNPMLSHAVGGIIHSMREFQLLWAPHANSYRRFQPGAYAPVTPCWGHDNRNAAVRIPETTGEDARFEHRVAGADANPYLAIAAVLASALDGMEHERCPGEPIVTQEDVQKREPLDHQWPNAIEAFLNSDIAGQTLGEPFRDVFAASARAEHDVIDARITDVECDAYLDSV